MKHRHKITAAKLKKRVKKKRKGKKKGK